MQTGEISDSKQAAVDFINVIEEETLKIQIAEATRANDIEKLSILLKKQKSLKG